MNDQIPHNIAHDPWNDAVDSLCRTYNIPLNNYSRIADLYHNGYVSRQTMLDFIDKSYSDMESTNRTLLCMLSAAYARIDNLSEEMRDTYNMRSDLIELRAAVEAQAAELEELRLITDFK